jgi:hypothetical protein
MARIKPTGHAREIRYSADPGGVSLKILIAKMATSARSPMKNNPIATRNKPFRVSEVLGFG